MLGDLQQPLLAVDAGAKLGLVRGGTARFGGPAQPGEIPILAYAGALAPESLGDPTFCADHGTRYAYVTGAMANGIASAELVEAIARGGMLAFFGAAGLHPTRVEAAIERLQGSLPDLPYGFNLIHSPNEPRLEAAVVDLYLRRKIRVVSASAYLALSLPVVRYRTAGIHEGPDGTIITPNRVVAKVSRIEVASRFLAPPPANLLRELVQAGELSEHQARLAARIPMARDLTAEADSGGHTDNRSPLTLLPTMLALRDRLQARHNYSMPLRVGAAGGIGTPAAAAAAFALGAAYVVTGSVNQACREAGTSELVRGMLAQAAQADVAMAPAADMFEMGVKVQVLKRGTMFAMRAKKLYELYTSYQSLESIPAGERAKLEKAFFRCSFEEAWAQTRAFFEVQDPAQNVRAQRDARHKMALVFRSYLGRASKWANTGEPSRRIDYQVWCGPAMGAFNEWVRGTFLEEVAQRDVVTVALNLMYGAALRTRVHGLRCQGVRVPESWLQAGPIERSSLEKRLVSADAP